jgi:hypothetical protein
MDYLADGYATYTMVAEPNSLSGGLVAAWASNWVTMLALGLPSFFLLLFPTRRGLVLEPRAREVLMRLSPVRQCVRDVREIALT